MIDGLTEREERMVSRASAQAFSLGAAISLRILATVFEDYPHLIAKVNVLAMLNECANVFEAVKPNDG